MRTNPKGVDLNRNWDVIPARWTNLTKADLGISRNMGPGYPKWMVYRGNPTKLDDSGVPPVQETSIWGLDGLEWSRLSCFVSARKSGGRTESPSALLYVLPTCRKVKLEVQYKIALVQF